MKTLIIGASGKIGKYFRNKKYHLTYRKNKIKNGIYFDLTKKNLSNIIKKFNIKKVVFLSALSNTDFCYKNERLSYKINCEKTKLALIELMKQNVYIIFFSTEFVFSGKGGGYKEDDKPRPANIYGKQKLIIENFLKKNYHNFSIMRIAKTYSDDFYDKTLITQLLEDFSKRKEKFLSANDQIFSPLYVRDLVKIVDYFLNKKIKGIYNVGGPKSYSRYQILRKIIKISKNFFPKNYQPTIIKTSLDEIKFIEKRPKNVSFDCRKLKKTISFKLTLIDKVIIKLLKKYALKISRR